MTSLIYFPESIISQFQFLPKSQLDDFYRYKTNITSFLAVSKPVVIVESTILAFQARNHEDQRFFQLFKSPVFWIK